MEPDNALKTLQAWCKKATEGYKNVCVNNMTKSWRDGLAFCALVHHFRPDLIDFDSLSPENILQNNSLAFSVAEKQLGIPALLDAEDMVTYEVPDKLSICTYLSQFYQYFEGNAKFRHKRIGVQGVKNSGIFQKIITDQVTSGERKHEVCQSCKNRVYILERLIVDGKLYHRICFKCSKCFSLLKPGAYVEGDDPGTYECVVCSTDEVPRIYKKSDSEPDNHGTDIIHQEPPSSEKKNEANENIKLSLLSSTIDIARNNFFQRHLNSHSQHINHDLEKLEKSNADNSKLLNKKSLAIDSDIISNSIKATSPNSSEYNLLLNTQKKSKSVENGTCKEIKHIVDESTLRNTQKSPILEKQSKSNFVKPPIAKKPELQLSVRRRSSESVEGQEVFYDKINPEVSQSDVFSHELSPNAESSRRSSLASSTSSIESSPKPSGHYQSVFLSDRLNRSLKPLFLRYEDDNSDAVKSFDNNSVSQLELPVIKSSNYQITSVDAKLPRPHSFGNFVPLRKNSDPINLPHTPITMKGNSDENISSIHNKWSKRSSEFLNRTYFKGLKEVSKSKPFTSCNELFLKEVPIQKISPYANMYKKEVKFETNKLDEQGSLVARSDADKIDPSYFFKSDEAKSKESKNKTDDAVVPIKSQSKLNESPSSITKEQTYSMKKELSKVKENSPLDNDKPFFTTIKLKPVGERKLPKITFENNRKPTTVNLQHNITEKVSKLNKTTFETNIPEPNIDTSENDNVDELTENKYPNIDTSEKDNVDELTGNKYPDELNPFGDDDDDDRQKIINMESFESQKYPETLNPFGDSDDDNDNYTQVSTPSGYTPTLVKNQNHNDNEKEEEYDQSLNPFASSDDDDESLSSSFSTPEMSRSSSKYDEANWRPTPAVRTSKICPNIGNYPFSSPNQNISALTPSPTSSLKGTQKKRRAPLPPEIKDGFPDDEKIGKGVDSPLPSSQYSPKSLHSPLLNRAATLSPSPKHLHKSKPAPPPPKFATLAVNSQRMPPSSIEMSDSVKNDKVKHTDNLKKIEFDSNSSEFQQNITSLAAGHVRKKRPAPPVPLPPRRQIKKISLKEIEAEMAEIEEKQQEFEKQGRELEEMIRDKDKEEQTIEEEEMIIQLFDLMNQKNILFRRQAELMYIKRSQRLEEEQVELEFQIRILLTKPANQKTEADKKHEEELLQKLLDVVEQRNEIVDSIEMDRRRQAEEDNSVQEQMEVKKSDLPMFTAEIEEKKSGKKKKHRGRLKENKKNSNQPKQEKNNKQKK